MKNYGFTKNLCWWIRPVFGFGFSIVMPERRCGYEPIVIVIVGCFGLVVAPKSSLTGWKWNEETQRSERIK
jgi:hypothetical protein